MMNDPDEGLSSEAGRAVAARVFASCWTYEKHETILHWGRYTADRGCRIELPINMFDGRRSVWVFGEEMHDGARFTADQYNDLWNLIQLPGFGSVDIQVPGLSDTVVSIKSRYVLGPSYVGYSSQDEHLSPSFSSAEDFDLRRVGIWKPTVWKDEREVRFRVMASKDDAHFFRGGWTVAQCFRRASTRDNSTIANTDFDFCRRALG
jgi:hypothetical protein